MLGSPVSPDEEEVLTTEEYQIYLMKEISRLKSQNAHAKEKNKKNAETNNDLSKQLKQYQEENNALRAENIKLRAERWNDIKNILKENQNLSVEVEEMNDMFQQLTGTNQNLRDRYDQMDSKAMELEEKCRILQKEINDVNKESEILERLNEQLLKQNQNLNRKIEKLKTIRTSPVIPGVDTESIDPELNGLPYYHGDIGRQKAEKILADSTDGCFLIRRCEMSLLDFTISVKSGKGVKHYLVRKEGRRLFISCNVFECWEALVNYYKRRPLQKIGSRHISLTRPFNVELEISI